MRVAIVGAGLAGLATAAAFRKSGHDITVFEQAEGLRASGLAINLWSNATSLLPGLGIPADRIPGEPFARMLLRASGRSVAVMELPARGLPHVNVERGELLGALAGLLPADAIRYGVRCADVNELASEHDLVVVADGANSTLRSAVAGPAGKRLTWTVWQASVTAELPELPADAGVSVVGSGSFTGIWRLGDGRVTWFSEEPARTPGEAIQVLGELRQNEDPMVRTVARATPDEEWTEWRAEDIRPDGPLYRGNIVLVGDAAHAMLPTIGQGACQSIEDAAVLAAAVAGTGSLAEALRRYQDQRLPRVRKVVGLARAGARGRRPNPASRLIPSTVTARFMALAGGPVLRRVTRPVIPG